MFFQTYKNTMKTILRSRTAWLALLLIAAVLIVDMVSGHYGYYDFDLGELIYDTDPRYVLEYDIYRQNVLHNTACATVMLYALPLFAVLSTIVVLLRDLGDRYFEIEKAGNVRPIAYFSARVLGIMTISIIVALGATCFGVYGYVISRGGVSGYPFSAILADAFPRILRYVGVMMVPILLALVCATLCIGNIVRHSLLAALVPLFYLVGNYLYTLMGSINGWKPYFQYLSNSPDRLRWYLAALDRPDPLAVMTAMGTSLTQALICIGITLGAAVLWSAVAVWRIRAREV